MFSNLQCIVGETRVAREELFSSYHQIPLHCRFKGAARVDRKDLLTVIQAFRYSITTVSGWLQALVNIYLQAKPRAMGRARTFVSDKTGTL